MKKQLKKSPISIQGFSCDFKYLFLRKKYYREISLLRAHLRELIPRWVTHIQYCNKLIFKFGTLLQSSNIHLYSRYDTGQDQPHSVGNFRVVYCTFTVRCHLPKTDRYAPHLTKGLHNCHKNYRTTIIK